MKREGSLSGRALLGKKVDRREQPGVQFLRVLYETGVLCRKLVAAID